MEYYILIDIIILKISQIMNIHFDHLFNYSLIISIVSTDIIDF